MPSSLIIIFNHSLQWHLVHSQPGAYLDLFFFFNIQTLFWKPSKAQLDQRLLREKQPPAALPTLPGIQRVLVHALAHAERMRPHISAASHHFLSSHYSLPQRACQMQATSSLPLFFKAMFFRLDLHFQKPFR